MKTLEEVIEYVTVAHGAQVDKAGNPYVTHPIRVMERLGPEAPFFAKAAALGHDLIEDTDLTAEDLLSDGFPAEAVDIILIVSRPKGDRRTYQQWVEEAIGSSGNEWAIRVKLADNADNADPDRIAQLPPEMQSIRGRYLRSIDTLETALENLLV